MKTTDILILGAVGIGVYFVVKGFNKIKDTAEEAIDSTASSIASIWLKLFPLPPAIQLLGNVKFPGNILVPLQQLAKAGAVKQNSDGDVFVSYSGMYWKLAPQVYGNWPATRVQ